MTITTQATADPQRWAAEQTVRMHSEPSSTDRATGRCARCLPGGGCPLLAWALAYLDGTRTVALYPLTAAPTATATDPAAAAVRAGGGRTGLAGHPGTPEPAESLTEATIG